MKNLHEPMITPVLITPFSSEGKIDHDSFENLFNHLHSLDAREYWLFGTGGEDWSINKNERLQLLQSSPYIRKNKNSFIIGVGNIEYSDSKLLIKQCFDLGFSRFHFIQRNRTLSIEHVFNQLYELSTINSSISLWGYFSDNYSRKLSYECLEKVPSHIFDNLEGIKYSTSDFYSLVKLKQDLPNLRILPAKAMQILETLAVGFNESTSIEACIHLEILNEIISSFSRDREQAKEKYIQFKSRQESCTTLAKYHNFMNIAEVKYLLAKQGIINKELVSSDLRRLSFEDMEKLDKYHDHYLV